MEFYPALRRLTHKIIREGFSNRLIQVGHTTTRDVEWWFLKRFLELKIFTWFHPSVSIQSGRVRSSGSFADRSEIQTIERGDLPHLDLGITYPDLNTDTQQHAYVLRQGEETAPEGLRKTLKSANRLRDIVSSQFGTGKTGNQILADSLAQAKIKGLRPSIYTHPLSFHGHAAGPTIGLWGQQECEPGQGGYPRSASPEHRLLHRAQR